MRNLALHDAALGDQLNKLTAEMKQVAQQERQEKGDLALQELEQAHRRGDSRMVAKLARGGAESAGITGHLHRPSQPGGNGDRIWPAPLPRGAWPRNSLMASRRHKK